MKKPIILIVNGRPGAGKDTFADILSKYASVKKISIIDLTKEMATMAGWDGFKNDRSRKFLSDLKSLIDDFNDASFCDIERKLIAYIDSDDYDYILIDARRIKDIDRMRKEFDAKSVYIENNNIKYKPTNIDDIEAQYNNSKYDLTISNNGTLRQFEIEIEATHAYLQSWCIEK